MEPENPDKYYVYIGTVIINEERKRAKIKRWWDEELKEFNERILSVEE